MDFLKLGWQQFETLCQRLIEASGFKLQRQEARGRDIGVDFSFKDASEAMWVAEFKFLSRAVTSASAVRQAALILSSAMRLMGAKHGLLVVSMLLPENLKADIEAREHITIWDARYLNELLSRYPEIERDFAALLDAQAVARGDALVSPPLEGRALELVSRLEALAPGRATFGDFEDLCVEILNYAFFPHLGVPFIQSRSDDGLDIRDAVYPIAGDSQFWQGVKRDCPTRFMVAEFKNYTQSVTQQEVESIQQYLFKKAMRMFGVLCSRQAPSESALRARRRAWMESDKLIVLLGDDELKDLIRARSAGEDPANVLDTQLEEFFLRLSP